MILDFDATDDPVHGEQGGRFFIFGQSPASIHLHRNDFMGVLNKGSGVESFGVAPGGYIGFFDPETGDHEKLYCARGASFPPTTRPR